jgi:FixJ family two-component response regulator
MELKRQTEARQAMTSEMPKPTVFVIGADQAFRTSMTGFLSTANMDVRPVSSASEFAAAEIPDVPSCIVLDVRMPGISGLQFQSGLQQMGREIPIVFVTDPADVPMPTSTAGSVPEPRAGAPMLLDAVCAALRQDAQRREAAQSAGKIRELFSALTAREREVIDMVGEGLMNKQVAWELGVSEITVKVHRGNAMRKLGTRSLATVVRMLDAVQVGGTPAALREGALPAMPGSQPAAAIGRLNAA